MLNINLNAADAQARADEGIDPRPYDADLITLHERACQAAAERLLQAEIDRERLIWLADHFETCADIDEGKPCTHLA